MTIREIAEFAGCSAETVRLKAKELFPARFEVGKRTVLTQKEAFAVTQKLKIVGNVAPRDLEVAPKSLEIASGSSLTTRDLDMISAIVSRTVAMTIQQLDVRLSKIETRVEERQALLPAPQVSDRDALRQLVAKEANHSKREERSVWNELYESCYYRRFGNLKLRAQNAKAKSTLDYIDREGLTADVLAVAVDLWGSK